MGNEFTLALKINGSVLMRPFRDVADIKAIVDEAVASNYKASGHAKITVGGLTEQEVFRIIKLIKGKETLLKKATGIEGVRILNFLNKNKIMLTVGKATLDYDTLSAQITLYVKIVEAAKKLKRASGKEKDIGNEKYYFRCFLLRLGFIGDEYKKMRKILLSRLDGDARYKVKSTQIQP